MELKNDIKERFVAFIDVLGFSEMVYRDKIHEIEGYFTTIQTTLNAMIKDGSVLEYLAISDSIIIFTPDSKINSFISLVSNIKMIQILLAQKGFWVRGGVAIGDACYLKNENIIFGKGYIDAFNLEKEAIFPRVIISPKIIKHLSDNYENFLFNVNGKRESDGLFKHGFYQEYKEKPFYDSAGNTEAMNKLIHEYQRNGSFRITKNDCVFISYAHFLIYLSMNIDMQYETSNLKKVLDSISNVLYSEQKHYLKYRWLKDYFLETILEIERNAIEQCMNLPNASFITKALEHFDSTG